MMALLVGGPLHGEMREFYSHLPIFRMVSPSPLGSGGQYQTYISHRVYRECRKDGVPEGVMAMVYIHESVPADREDSMALGTIIEAGLQEDLGLWRPV